MESTSVDLRNLSDQLCRAYDRFQGTNKEEDLEAIEPSPDRIISAVHSQRALRKLKDKARWIRRESFEKEEPDHLSYENKTYSELQRDAMHEVALSCMAVWLSPKGHWFNWTWMGALGWHYVRGHFHKMEQILFSTNPLKNLGYILSRHVECFQALYEKGSETVKAPALAGMEYAIEERLLRSVTTDDHLPGFLEEIGRSDLSADFKDLFATQKGLEERKRNLAKAIVEKLKLIVYPAQPKKGSVSLIERLKGQIANFHKTVHDHMDIIAEMKYKEQSQDTSKDAEDCVNVYWIQQILSH